jgi:hypothetical protein
MKESPAWLAHLEFLLAGAGRDLEGGAEIEVSDPGGEVVFLAPLARHYRLDDEGILWLRPVVGGYRPVPENGVPPYAFSLAAARRRGLLPTEARRDGEDLVFELNTGQRARIRPARGEALAELQRWDSFYYVVLTAGEEADLDALWADSDIGRWE